MFVKDGPRNLHLKFGLNHVRNIWDIPDMDKCHQDKCCLDKCHRESVLDVPRNLPLKFHQNHVSTILYIGDVESVREGVGGWGVHSHFHV